jgi:hypothetical protein
MKRLLLALLLGFVSFAWATTYQALSLEEMFSKAEIAFYGVVITVEPIEREGELWTKVSFELLESFKGEEEAVSVELLFYGGEPLDGSALNVSLMPQFKVGEKVLILAYKGDFYSPIVGFRQGLWHETETGFMSETDFLLGLDSDNKLILEGAGASPEDILNAVRDVFKEQP